MRRAVAAIGLCSWDRFLVLDRHPEPGDYATVQHQFEQAGGTTGNTCAALATLGVEVALASSVGDDREGRLLIESLDATGCDTSMITRHNASSTDSSYILISDHGTTRERSILWVKGAHPRHGDKLPIERLLEHRWLLVDVSDDRLREFILELPAHLSPRTQLIGAMTYLTDTDPELGWNHLLRHDMVFGNQRELMHLSGTTDMDAAIARAKAEMPGNACRVMYVTRGSAGALAIRPAQVTTVPAFELDILDTTGAGDAFVAGALWGVMEGLEDAEILERGNAVGGLCCRAMGARAGLPTRDDVFKLINEGPRHPHDQAP